MSNRINRLFARVFSSALYSFPALLPVVALASTPDFDTFNPDVRMLERETQNSQKMAAALLEGKITCNSNGATETCNLQLEEKNTGRIFVIGNPVKVRSLMSQGKTEYRVQGITLGTRIEVETMTAANKTTPNENTENTAENNSANIQPTGT